PSPTFTGFPNDEGKPYTMCHGMFPWFVYLNHGNGVFGQPRTCNPVFGCLDPPIHDEWGPLPDQILYQPIPLETDAGDSAIISSPIGQAQGTVDIDGDGYADAVHQAGSTGWTVFFNDHTGWLKPYSQSFPYMFTTAGSIFDLNRSDGFVGQPAPLATQGIF